MVAKYTKMVLQNTCQELVNAENTKPNFGMSFFVSKPLQYTKPIFEDMISSEKQKDLSKSIMNID